MYNKIHRFFAIMLQVKCNLSHASKCRIILIILLILVIVSDCSIKRKRIKLYGKHRSTASRSPFERIVCAKLGGNVIKARHKSCFLRPDTGPCRADIVQWYFDVKQRKCYRFFWGGCQGNGNRFERKSECLDYCYLNTTTLPEKNPFFCSLSFDYGTCFGHFNRWYWDSYSKTCKTRLYSGCGGNQNNFETRNECMSTCLRSPNNTLQSFDQFTTCFPIQMEGLN